MSVANDIEQAAKAAKQAIEILEHMIKDAHAGVDESYVVPLAEQMPRFFTSLKRSIQRMIEGIDSIPKGKEKERAKKITKQVGSIFKEESVFKWENSRWVHPASAEKLLHKMVPLVQELDQLFTGQKVLFKSAQVVDDFKEAILVRNVLARAAKFAKKAPSADDIEEWWDHMTPGQQQAVAKKTKSPPNLKKWDANDWEKVTDYYVRVEQGDSQGYHPSRNV